MSERKYRCYYCKHHVIDYDVFRSLGDCNICPRWTCSYRDDERRVPGCDDFEPKEGGDGLDAS